ncbi:hypothetical protein PR048_000207 [Dryococelus australis]|uniref:Uncharacterized protein n=1 Tax=Dryococelus australis TaxID=614101 RepID=A0ABQ9IE07_9NEOP|nr:hypothetical protein PR048_000207 [Dryococelus australis]
MWSGAEMKGREETEDPREGPADQRHRPGTIPTCESPVTRPGIEPGSPWREGGRANRSATAAPQTNEYSTFAIASAIILEKKARRVAVACGRRRVAATFKLTLHEAEEYPGSRTSAGLQKRPKLPGFDRRFTFSLSSVAVKVYHPLIAESRRKDCDPVKKQFQLYPRPMAAGANNRSEVHQVRDTARHSLHYYNVDSQRHHWNSYRGERPDMLCEWLGRPYSSLGIGDTKYLQADGALSKCSKIRSVCLDNIGVLCPGERENCQELGFSRGKYSGLCRGGEGDSSCISCFLTYFHSAASPPTPRLTLSIILASRSGGGESGEKKYCAVLNIGVSRDDAGEVRGIWSSAVIHRHQAHDGHLTKMTTTVGSSVSGEDGGPNLDRLGGREVSSTAPPTAPPRSVGAKGLCLRQGSRPPHIHTDPTPGGNTSDSVSECTGESYLVKEPVRNRQGKLASELRSVTEKVSLSRQEEGATLTVEESENFDPVRNFTLKALYVTKVRRVGKYYSDGVCRHRHLRAAEHIRYVVPFAVNASRMRGFLGMLPERTDIGRHEARCRIFPPPARLHGCVRLTSYVELDTASGISEYRAAPECKGRGNGRSPKKTRRVTSSDMIPTHENPVVTRPGIEPGLLWSAKFVSLLLHAQTIHYNIPRELEAAKHLLRKDATTPYSKVATHVVVRPRAAVMTYD